MELCFFLAFPKLILTPGPGAGAALAAAGGWICFRNMERFRVLRNLRRNNRKSTGPGAEKCSTLLNFLIGEDGSSGSWRGIY